MPPPPPPPIVIFSLAFGRSVSEVNVRSALVASIPGLKPNQVLEVAMATPLLTRRLSELILNSSHRLNRTGGNGAVASGTTADIQLEPSPSLSHSSLLATINGSPFVVLMSADLGVSVSLSSEAQLHIHEYSSALALPSTTVVALEATLIPLVAIAATLILCFWYQRRQRLANSLLSKGFDSAAMDEASGGRGWGKGASGSGGTASLSQRKRIKEALQKRGYASKRAQIMPVGATPTDQRMAEGDESTGGAAGSREEATGAAATRGRCASLYAHGRCRLSSVAVAPSPNGTAVDAESRPSVDASGLAAQRGSTKSFKLGFREALMRNSAIGCKAAASSNLLGSHAGRSDEGAAPPLTRVKSNGAIERARKALSWKASWSGGRGSRARLYDGGGEGESERASKAADRPSKAAGSSEAEAPRESRRDGALAHGVGGGFAVTRI